MAQQFHEGTAQELVPYRIRHPDRRFRLIELSSGDEETPITEGRREERQNLADTFADLIEAAKHVERETPVPHTDPHEAAYMDALEEKYRKMGLHL